MSFFEVCRDRSIPDVAKAITKWTAKNRLIGPLVNAIPFLRTINLIGEFNRNIELNNFVEASKKILSSLKFIIEAEDEIPANLKAEGKPLIVVSNHEGLIEPIFIAELIERNDHLIIAGIENVKFGEVLAGHLLPVRPSKYAGERDSMFYGPGMTRDKIRELNEKSLRRASEVVAQGSMLTIFPWGGRSPEKGQWHKGLGQIIHGIPEGIQHEVDILPIFFSGHDRKSLIALIRELLICGSPMKDRHVRARIGNPINIKSIKDSSGNPEITVQNIRKIYLNQFISR